MKSVYATLGFALSASAASLVARDQCCFGLTASGGESGVVGQLSDGQNRIGQTSGLANQAGQYCLNNGAITDGNGRGCILTPPTTQFQCDVGASPSTGFSLSGSNLAHNGSTTFVACPTGDNGGYNIYTVAPSGQGGCVDVTLSTGGACSSSSSSRASAASTASVASASAASKSAASAASASASSASAASASSASAASAASSASAASAASSASAASASSAAAASKASLSAPAPVQETHTVFETTYVTVSACSASSAPVAPAPASSAPASHAPASSAPASSTRASSSSAPAATTSAKASTAASSASSASTCQTSLSGAYQTPHAIIPVNKQSPNTAYGTQYNAYISSANSTIFNFDIPTSYAGKTCTLIFLFPTQAQLETSSFTQSGSGGLTFSLLSSAANQQTTYANAPAVSKQLDAIASVAPGNSYVVSTGSCAAGTTQSIEVSSTNGYSLEFFEDWNPSPIGLFLTSC